MAVDDALKLYKLAKEQGWIDKLLSLAAKRHKILILGASGVGKSNLTSSLTTLAPEVIHHSRRTAGTPRTSIKYESVPFDIIDTPGQVPQRAVRTRAVTEHCSTAAVVMNVVCYGYHEYARGKGAAFDEHGKVKPEYTETNREREREFVGEWSELVGVQSKCQLVTVVTKADLWWELHDEVLDYYETGEYFDALGPCQSFAPTVIPYCSVFHKLYGVGELSGSFDEEDRLRTRANLLKSLCELVGKGGANGR